MINLHNEDPHKTCRFYSSVTEDSFIFWYMTPCLWISVCRRRKERMTFVFELDMESVRSSETSGNTNQCETASCPRILESWRRQ